MSLRYRLAWLIGAALWGAGAWAIPIARSQPPLTLERVDVLPAGGAEEGTVRALLPLRVGQAVDVESLSAARATLAGCGAFSTVELSTARGSGPGRVVVVVEVALDRKARLETGFGHEPLEGWYLNLVGLRWNAPFHEPGRLRMGLRLGLRSGGLLGEYERTAVGGAPVDLLARGFAGTSTWIAFDGDDEFRQRLQLARAELGARVRAGDGARVGVFAGVERVEPDATLDQLHGDAELPADALVPSIHGDVTLLRLRAEASLDRRDAPAYPRRGVWLGGRLGGALVDHRNGFGRAEADARAWVPLPGRATVALHADATWVGPGAPYFERAVFGGVASVRGFRDASLSGPLGARAVWQAGLELRRPLLGSDAPVPRLTGVLFADVGQAWDAQGVRQDPAVGVGYGLRIRVPWVSVFGIDVGLPVTHPVTRDPFWVHGSLGFTF